jgi:hypothetical protein
MEGDLTEMVRTSNTRQFGRRDLLLVGRLDIDRDTRPSIYGRICFSEDPSCQVRLCNVSHASHIRETAGITLVVRPERAGAENDRLPSI